MGGWQTGMDPDEQRLWDGLRAGDPNLFQELYQLHFSPVRNFLRRYLGDGEVAKELTQEAFLQLWKHPNGFDPRRGTLKAYLFGIARNHAAQWLRRQPPQDTEGHQQQTAPTTQTNLIVEQLFARLNPDMRSLIWLREIEGYSYAELADILAVPLGTVRSRLFAAREALRRLWNGRR